MTLHELTASMKDLESAGYPNNAYLAYYAENSGHPQSRYCAALLVRWAGSQVGGSPVMYTNRASFRQTFRQVQHRGQKMPISMEE